MNTFQTLFDLISSNQLMLPDALRYNTVAASSDQTKKYLLYLYTEWISTVLQQAAQIHQIRTQTQTEAILLDSVDIQQAIETSPFFLFANQWLEKKRELPKVVAYLNSKLSPDASIVCSTDHETRPDSSQELIPSTATSHISQKEKEGTEKKEKEKVKKKKAIRLTFPISSMEYRNMHVYESSEPSGSSQKQQ